MRVAITGSSGLIGTALRARLEGAGHTVVPVVRRAAAPGEIAWDPAAGTIDHAALSDVDAVVHLAGAGIGDKRWTDAYKQEILESRTRSTTLMAETMASLDHGPRVLLSASGIGVYGDRGDEELDETSEHGSGFLPDVCIAWEAGTTAAEAAGIRVAHLRTGIVLSPEGGALKKQLPLFKLGLGGRFGAGSQWQSWISIDDEVGAIEHLLTSEVTGPVNLTAPAPVTNADFASTLASVLKRPAFLPIPKFGPKALLGGELAETLLFEGQKVLPQVLQHDGYVFQHSDLETALRALLGR
ncbi:MAG: TIGR01777 family protein [Ilumatobacter sp.]|nr:MAG: TIGR01777 family protein [Ilumatobacter sp.]